MCQLWQQSCNISHHVVPITTFQDECNHLHFTDGISESQRFTKSTWFKTIIINNLSIIQFYKSIMMLGSAERRSGLCRVPSSIRCHCRSTRRLWFQEMTTYQLGTPLLHMVSSQVVRGLVFEVPHSHSFCWHFIVLAKQLQGQIQSQGMRKQILFPFLSFSPTFLTF